MRIVHVKRKICQRLLPSGKLPTGKEPQCRLRPVDNLWMVTSHHGPDTRGSEHAASQQLALHGRNVALPRGKGQLPTHAKLELCHPSAEPPTLPVWSEP